jgi:hypothetical protein
MKESKYKPPKPHQTHQTHQTHKLILFLDRRYLILEDQHKQMQSEYNDKKEKIKQMIPSDEDYHQ